MKIKMPWMQAALLALVAGPLASAGFYTTGTMRPEAGALHFHEIVKGATGGVREVKSTSRVLPDGRLHVSSKHLKGEEWVPGHDIFYVEDPKAVVRFKD